MTNADVMTCLRSAGRPDRCGGARGGEDPDAIDWRGRVALIVGWRRRRALPDEVACSATGWSRFRWRLGWSP